MSSTKFESDPERDTHTAGFAERVRANQQKLTAELKPHYDFIVCVSGSSGSVVSRRIEDWHGTPDPRYRGTGGPVFVQPAPDPNPVAPAMVEAARSVGIPTFQSQNGLMMEGEGGASITDLRVRDGVRQSVFRSYAFPYMDRPNLTVLCHALVTQLIVSGKRAIGVEI